jgi:hypothetical protein
VVEEGDESLVALLEVENALTGLVDAQFVAGPHLIQRRQPRHHLPSPSSPILDFARKTPKTNKHNFGENAK